MVNVEIRLYMSDGNVESRQMSLTEEGFVEIEKSGDTERKMMVCGLVKVDEAKVDRVEVKRIAEKE